MNVYVRTAANNNQVVPLVRKLIATILCAYSFIQSNKVHVPFNFAPEINFHESNTFVYTCPKDHETTPICHPRSPLARKNHLFLNPYSPVLYLYFVELTCRIRILPRSYITNKLKQLQLRNNHFVTLQTAARSDSFFQRSRFLSDVFLIWHSLSPASCDADRSSKSCGLVFPH